MKNQNEYVEKVKGNYVPRERTKLDELKRLDRKVKLPAEIAAYTAGAASSLVLGTGMCLALKVIGTSIMSATALMSVGVVVGCAGIALCIANYFVYKAFLKARKRKYASRILALSDEILN